MTLPLDLYQRIFQHSLDGVLVVRPDGTILRANDAACRMLGRSEEEIRRLGRKGLIVEDDQVREVLRKRAADGTATGELPLVRADGSTIWVDFVTGMLPEVVGEGLLAYTIIRDVTARRALEEQVHRSARALRLRTACSAAVVRAASEPELFAAVCRAMVEVGGYRMAWVGLADDDEKKTLRTAACAGHDEGFLAEAAMVWADVPRGQSPCGVAVRSGHLVVNRDFEADPALAPWREAARARGYRSSTALPLVHGGRRVGVLGVYSATLESFESEEVDILAGLADDVAYAALALRAQHERDLAEQARRAGEARLELLADSSRAYAELGHDADGVLRELAQRACDALGDVCRVQLFSDDGHQLELAALSSRDPTGRLAREGSSPHSTLSVQLSVRDQVLGTMDLTRAPHERPHFTTDDLRFAQELADRAALAVHNARLFERAERLAAAVDQASEMVMITDAQGLIRYVNPAFEATTGYSRDEAVGKNPRFLKSGAQDAAFYGVLWGTLTRGDTWRGRLVNKKKDGTHYTEDAVISPVRDADGTLTGFVGLKRDITRDLLLEAQLVQSQKMDSIGRLAGGVAHDFNNLLTIILGSAQLMLDSVKEGDPLLEHVAEIRNAGDRAAALTAQLLAFGRRQALKFQPLDLNRLVSDVQRMLTRIIGEDVELVQQLAPNLGAVKADPSQLEQVLLNLAVNARDAMPKGGRLSIETRNVDLVETRGAYQVLRPGPYVLLRVSDTGAGMDAATMARIFEPFFTTKERGKGTGLGLSTVYGVVTQSGGGIDVTSELGRGTTFEVLLPRVDDAPAEPKPAAPQVNTAGAETVLVVEDEDGVRRLVRRVLERAGYLVLTASNGSEGLHAFERHQGTIDLVLSDVVMPVMSGPDFVAHARKLRPAIKVLFMSGYNDDAVTRHGVMEGTVDLINKPLTQDQLLQRVRAALDRAPGTSVSGRPSLTVVR
ncbi:MAG: PAS domain S-box protein [Deltaproteobacteria bacterium]|nr:PAS domain S-box protein [Deltaproteobacteria bacterium]